MQGDSILDITFSRLVQPLKFEVPIPLRLLGKMIVLSPIQPLNTSEVKVWTPSGIVREVKLVQPSNVLGAQAFILLGKDSAIRDEQPEKHLTPILLTLPGIEMFFRDLQSAKAHAPILLMLFGIETEAN